MSGELVSNKQKPKVINVFHEHGVEPEKDKTESSLNFDEKEMNEQFNSADLKHYIKGLIDEENSDGDDDEINSELFHKAIDLKGVKVRECMIPRTELKAVPINTNIEELVKIFIKEKHSRLLVFKDNIDDIVGYIHHFDLFKNPKRIEDILYDVISVPETPASASAKLS